MTVNVLKLKSQVPASIINDDTVVFNDTWVIVNDTFIVDFGGRELIFNHDLTKIILINSCVILEHFNVKDRSNWVSSNNSTFHWYMGRKNSKIVPDYAKCNNKITYIDE